MRTPTLQPVPESLPADHVTNSGVAGSGGGGGGIGNSNKKKVSLFRGPRIPDVRDRFNFFLQI